MTGIYVAQQVFHDGQAAMWRGLRDRGHPIISSWINEPSKVLLNEDHYLKRVLIEIELAELFVVYIQPGDLPLTSVLLSVGAALASNTPIYVVAPEIPTAALGSWIDHPLVRIQPSIGIALAEYVGSNKSPELSPRENEVLSGLARGLSSKEIARELGIEEGTVKVHTTSILRRLGVTNRTAAAVKAVRQGWF